jgi:RHS repeat-associated protein
MRTHKVSSAGVTMYATPFYTVRNGSLATQHVFVGESRVASVQATVGQPENAQRYWYHGDHLESVEYVTDAGGQPVETVQYYPFGATWVDSSTHSDRMEFRFTGKPLDAETGLYYFGARYYDPQQAQWINPDPILQTYMRGDHNGGVFLPIHLNLFGYCLNSPIRYLDPNGAQVDAVNAWYYTDRGQRLATGTSSSRVTDFWPEAGTRPDYFNPTASESAILVGSGVGLMVLAEVCPICVFGLGVGMVANAAEVSHDPWEAAGGLMLMAMGYRGGGGGSAGGGGEPPGTPGAPSNPGRPFDPTTAQPGQIITGVDPNTLTAGRANLVRGKLENQRQLVATGTPRATPIEVEPSGTIYDGNHGARAAAEAGRPVDVRVRDPMTSTANPGHGTIMQVPVRER